MKTYVYSPLPIEAFQFSPACDYPEWFKEQIELGRAFPVINKHKKSYVFLENKRGKYKAFTGDWVCRDEFGHVSVVSQGTFEHRFDEILGETEC